MSFLWAAASQCSHCGSFDRFFENVATTPKETVGIIVRFFQGAFSLLFLADQIGLLFDEFISIGARVTTLGGPPSQLVP